jgi:hypothetical protein
MPEQDFRKASLLGQWGDLHTKLDSFVKIARAQVTKVKAVGVGVVDPTGDIGAVTQIADSSDPEPGIRKSRGE